jgi:hypothetical protein
MNGDTVIWAFIYANSNKKTSSYTYLVEEIRSMNRCKHAKDMILPQVFYLSLFLERWKYISSMLTARS